LHKKEWRQDLDVEYMLLVVMGERWWSVEYLMPEYATQALYCWAATNMSLQKLLSLHKSMQVGVYRSAKL